MRKPHLVSLVLGAVLAAGTAVPTPAFAEAASATHATTKVSARTLLKHLTVQPESHSSSYVRSKFKLWVDADHDGENTRAEVLRAESSTRVTENKYHTVKTGHWTSRYDGKTYTAASKLDIDHLVPLEEAWTSGAYKWSEAKRQAYANDLAYGPTLIAVSLHSNRSKGDKEPNAYLPPKTSYRCTYVRNWIAVKYRWTLAVNASEKRALSAALTKYCKSVTITRPGKPTGAVSVTSKPAPTARPTPTRSTPVYTPAPTRTATPAPSQSITPAPGGTRTPAPAPTQTSASQPTAAPTQAALLYANCTAADAAGASPIYSWDDGYRSALDGDHDGIACEPGDPYSTDPSYTPPSYPSGATAICRDGTYSYSAHRSGTCSGHGGVSQWL